MGRWTGKSCRLSTMMLMTSVFFLVEIIVGYVTNSIALVADSFHMLSDLVALVVGLAAVKISKKVTKGNTYGWQRAEVLGALINCVFLLALCFSILVESIKRLVELERVENPLMMLQVGGLGLLVNLFGLCLFGGHGHSHGGGHGHSHGGGHGHSHESKTHDHRDTLNVEMEIDCNSVKNASNDHQKIHADYEIANGDLGETRRLVENESNSPTMRHTTSATAKSLENDINIKHNQNGCSNHNNSSHDDRIIGNNSYNQNNCSNHSNGNLDSSSNVGSHNHVNGSSNHKSSCYKISVEGEKDFHNDKEVYSVGDGIEIELEKASKPASMNMRGVFLHVLGDALGSLVVIISGLAIWLVEGEWKFYLDPVLSLIIVGIILITTIPLFKETSHILLQAVPGEICVERIKKQLMEIEGVIGIHECHIWQLSGRRIIASAHVHCKDLQDYMAMASKIKDVFHGAGIHSTTIQPEVDKSSDQSVCSIQCPVRDGRSSCVENTCCMGRQQLA